MHHSRLGCVVIDCETDDLADACKFWSAALGGSGSVDPDGKYAPLEVPGGPRVLLQAVDHAPRVHLDIETDNIDGEAERLSALGAKEVARLKGWVVMEAPTGHRYCIVKPQRGDFPGDAAAYSAQSVEAG
ncbi:MAG: VOC family protein [Pseudomonadota bacterium]